MRSPVNVRTYLQREAHDEHRPQAQRAVHRVRPDAARAIHQLRKKRHRLGRCGAFGGGAQHALAPAQEEAGEHEHHINLRRCWGTGVRRRVALGWNIASGSCGRQVGDDMARVRELVRMGRMGGLLAVGKPTWNAEQPKPKTHEERKAVSLALPNWWKTVQISSTWNATSHTHAMARTPSSADSRVGATRRAAGFMDEVSCTGTCTVSGASTRIPKRLRGWRIIGQNVKF